MSSKKLFNVFALLLMMAGVSSCEKMVIHEKDGEAVPEDANVVLNVRMIEQMPFDGQTRSDVMDYCTRLNFDVYDENGEKVDYVNQTSGDANFGVVSFSLPEGRYLIVVVAHSGSKNPSFYDNGKISISGKELGDTFWCCEEVDVASERIQRNLALERIVAMVRFISDDMPPSTANWMRFSYKGNRGSFNGFDGCGLSTTKNTRQTIELDISEDQRQFEFYMIPSEDQDELNIEVLTKHVEGTIIDNLSEKTIEGIPVRRNTITVCRGNLFDNADSSSSSYFTISVDAEWEETITVSF